jgi:DNA-binding SARP family transcriptional activator/Tfp pilus assembly protein PilF
VLTACREGAVRFGILGPLLVIGDDRVESPVPAPRQRTLLAALLVRANRLVPVDELAELVWDGTPPAAAARTLRSYVVRLRHAVGPVVAARIVTRDPGYLCRVAAEELDCLRFDVLCRDGVAAMHAREWHRARSALGEALALWRGAPLADVGSRALRDECAPVLEQARLQALGWRIDADLHLGRHAELIPELRALVTAHPLQEQSHSQLMLALYRCGRRAEALHAFERARQLLRDELGVEPGERLHDMHRRMLAGAPALEALADDAPPNRTAGGRPAVPRQLPAGIRHFVGRIHEKRLLDSLVDEATVAGAVAIVALAGMAGVGKTSLAVHWGRRVAHLFPDGQLYVDLRGFDQTGEIRTAAQAIRQFLDAFEVPAQRIPTDPDAQAAVYRTLLADRRVLIVLDNARDAEQVRPLLPGASGCLVIVTSRNQLTPLIATQDAYPVALDLLTAPEARDLLAQRLGTDRVASEPDAVDVVIERCARLPLALAVAAARVAAAPDRRLAALASELSGARANLDALSAGDAATDVRSVLSWSYQALPLTAARLFRLLGLHPGSDISAPAAASLAGLPPDRINPLLAELVQANLLVEHRPGRYTVHDLLRGYASELTATYDTVAERCAAVRRVLDHYLHTAHVADGLLYPARDQLTPAAPQPGTTPERLADRKQALAWFTAERGVLMAAVAMRDAAVIPGQTTTADERAAPTVDHQICQLSQTLWTFLYRQGHWDDWAAAGHSALAAARRLGDLGTQGYAHRSLAQAYTWLGRFDDADAHLRQALELFGEAGDLTGQAHAHYTVSYLWEERGRHAEALAHARQSLNLYEAARHQFGRANALNAIGWIHAQLGDHQLALGSCQQALALLEELDDIVGQAQTLDSLGFAHHRLGQHTEAISCFRRALALFHDLDDYYDQADTLSHLGDAHCAAGDTGAARDYWQQALVIFEDLGHADADPVRGKIEGLRQADAASRPMVRDDSA